MAAALIYCGVAESAVLNLIGISAGTVGASAASPWALTGKLYDRLHGR